MNAAAAALAAANLPFFLSFFLCETQRVNKYPLPRDVA
jgi:hypothetical protein